MSQTSFPPARPPRAYFSPQAPFRRGRRARLLSSGVRLAAVVGTRAEVACHRRADSAAGRAATRTARSDKGAESESARQCRSSGHYLRDRSRVHERRIRVAPTLQRASRNVLPRARGRRGRDGQRPLRRKRHRPGGAGDGARAHGRRDGRVGSVSGARLNPGVSLAFARCARGRVPGYIAAQFAGAAAVCSSRSSARRAHPAGPIEDRVTAMIWEAVLAVGRW